MRLRYDTPLIDAPRLDELLDAKLDAGIDDVLMQRYASPVREELPRERERERETEREIGIGWSSFESTCVPMTLTL